MLCGSVWDRHPRPGRRTMTGHSAGIDDVVESSRHQGSTVLHDEESDVSITGRGRAYGSDAAAAKDAKRPKRITLV